MAMQDEPQQWEPSLSPTRERQMAVASALRTVLPADSVLMREEELRPYECDGLSAFRQIPMLVVLPRTEEQVRDILLICYRLEVPVVARGAGTGLSGGAMPHAAGIILSLARLNRILELDPLGRMARVQPGVRNLAGIGGCRSPRAVLRAGSILPDRLLDRRQCGRELRRRALSEVRADGAQRAAGARLHDRRRADRVRLRRVGRPRARPAGAGDRLRGAAAGRHRSHRQAHPAARSSPSS